MSLVGTRPPTVDEWDKYELHHRARLATKPGLTGMWQVSGRSNITDFRTLLMWCILLILLPIALLFAESSMNNLQSVSIVAAFPIGAVIVMITVSFMKDAKKYMESLEESAKEKVKNS